VVGAGQACRTRADDSHLLLFLLLGRGEAFPGLKGVISYEAFQGVNGGSFVELLAIAGSFARVETNPAADPGKGVLLNNLLPGPEIILLPS
jgi:hypothetical protein